MNPLIRNTAALDTLRKLALVWLQSSGIEVDRPGSIIRLMDESYPGGWLGFSSGFLSVC